MKKVLFSTFVLVWLAACAATHPVHFTDEELESMAHEQVYTNSVTGAIYFPIGSVR